MRTRILHLADLHLGDRHSYLGVRASERREEADRTLRRAVDWALRPDSRIGGVVIAGDLLDHFDPPAPLVDSVVEDLRRLLEAGIKVLTVPGNHDEYSYPSSVYRRREWPGTLVTEPAVRKVERWNLDGVTVDLYAMAFTAGRSRPPYDEFPVAAQDGVRTVAVLHGSLDTGGSDRSLPLRRESLSALGIDYLALGHIHLPAQHRLGRGWACYPGRIEGGGFEDPGGAGLVVVDMAGETTEPTRLPFPGREIAVERWNLSSLHDEEDLVARLERIADRERIVRLVLEGIAGFPVEPERLLRRFGDRFWHLEIPNCAETLGSLDLDAIEREPTIRGRFVALARKKLSQAREDDERRRLTAALRQGLAAFAAGGPAAPAALPAAVEENWKSEPARGESSDAGDPVELPGTMEAAG